MIPAPFAPLFATPLATITSAAVALLLWVLAQYAAANFRRFAQERTLDAHLHTAVNKVIAWLSPKKPWRERWSLWLISGALIGAAGALWLSSVFVPNKDDAADLRRQLAETQKNLDALRQARPNTQPGPSQSNLQPGPSQPGLQPGLQPGVTSPSDGEGRTATETKEPKAQARVLFSGDGNYSVLEKDFLKDVTVISFNPTPSMLLRDWAHTIYLTFAQRDEPFKVEIDNTASCGEDFSLVVRPVAFSVVRNAKNYIEISAYSSENMYIGCQVGPFTATISLY